ncbi:MAG TPA: hypothetical protein VFU59_07390, partial [Candidatus Eisenbacteria bacterium]|nr:hypothetical protein [Candidatus Eisenbacteria bacterium]
SALHQITSGDYPEVRPPEVIVTQGDLRWQPVRLTREEDHLSELGLGLRTFEPADAGMLRPSAPAGGIAASVTPPNAAPGANPAMPNELPWPVKPEEMILTPDELIVGPQFPRDPAAEKPAAPAHPPRRPEVVVSAGAPPEGGLNNRLGSLDVQEFQVSALERIDDALRPVEIRELGEVPAPESVAGDAPGLVADAGPETRATTAGPTRSAVWGEEPAAAAPLPAAAAPVRPATAPVPVPAKSAAAAPAPPTAAVAPAPVAPPAEGATGESAAADDAAARPIVEGNRTAFETWLRRLGGK